MLNLIFSVILFLLGILIVLHDGWINSIQRLLLSIVIVYKIFTAEK